MKEERNDEPVDLPMETIQQVIAGDNRAIREFYLHYNRTVRWAVGLRVYRWRELVPEFDDIVQEVWWELSRRDFKRLSYYTGDRDVPFHRYLVLITARLGWKIAKRRLGHPQAEVADVSESDEGGFVMKLMQADFLGHLARLVDQRLNAVDRRIFYGYYVRGELLKEIATELEVTEEAIYQRHRRLLHKLRELADELIGDPPRDKPDLVAVMLASFVALSLSSATEHVREIYEAASASFMPAKVEVEHE